MKNNQKRIKILIIILSVIIIILLLAVGYFIYDDYHQKEDTKECTETCKQKCPQIQNIEGDNTNANTRGEINESVLYELDDFRSYVYHYGLNYNKVIITLNNYSFNGNNISLKVIINYTSDNDKNTLKLFVNDSEIYSYDNLNRIAEFYFKTLAINGKTSLVFVVYDGTQEGGEYILAFDKNAKIILNLSDVAIADNGIDQSNETITVTEYGEFKPHMLGEFQDCAYMNDYIAGKENDLGYQINLYKFNGNGFDKIVKESKKVKDLVQCVDN